MKNRELLPNGKAQAFKEALENKGLEVSDLEIHHTLPTDCGTLIVYVLYYVSKSTIFPEQIQSVIDAEIKYINN